jgi:hypothetical protein
LTPKLPIGGRFCCNAQRGVFKDVSHLRGGRDEKRSIFSRAHMLIASVGSFGTSRELFRPLGRRSEDHIWLRKVGLVLHHVLADCFDGAYQLRLLVCRQIDNFPML